MPTFSLHFAQLSGLASLHGSAKTTLFQAGLESGRRVSRRGSGVPRPSP